MTIRIKGANENNLQNIEVDFNDGLTVVTGISGSGKSSLVFSTLYHEARRRFLDLFSRDPTNRLAPSNVQEITGIGPTIAIGQNILNQNPNSTLATASGLHPFLRLLYANFGERRCSTCGKSFQRLSKDEIIEKIMNFVQKGSLSLFAPVVRQVKGSHKTLLKMFIEEFDSDSIFVNNEPYEYKKLDPFKEHDIEIKITTLDSTISPTIIRSKLDLISSLGASAIKIRTSNNTELIFSFSNVCGFCGTWLSDLKPIHFHTQCHHCSGKGCTKCLETGLYPEAATVFWKGNNLPSLLKLSVREVKDLFKTPYLPTSADRLIFEISKRLDALMTVGLGYISLNRSSPTLSRGESQRVRLAISLSSKLEDMVHVLDEPTIGLSISDVNRLIPAFRKLLGSVIYVEHDRVAAAAADHVIDLGPGAGRKGGSVTFRGTPSLLWNSDTTTGHYFSMRTRVKIPSPRLKPNRFIKIEGANLRNLKEIDISIPLSRFTVITGPSGSGKSTLVEDVLFTSLSRKEVIGCKKISNLAKKVKPIIVDQKPIGKNPRSNPATYTQLAAIVRELFAKNTKIKLTPSHFSFNRPEGACPDCKGMGAIEVKMRYLPSTWISCSTCNGKRFSSDVLNAKINIGNKSISIADFYDLTVEEVLEGFIDKRSFRMDEKNRKKAKRLLTALKDIGLGYIRLGQPSPTLSGGEAQRVKLAKYLGMRSLEDRIIILDEPSTGLHPHDVAGLLVVLDKLVRTGATVVVVEHNSDFIRAADWVIDLGPGAGPDGGNLLYSGSIEGLIKVKNSSTAQGLREEEEIKPKSSQKSIEEVNSINITKASAHNLKNVSVNIPKEQLNVVTGVSGSGKSSLIGSVLRSEADRRFLETLSLYERQGISEGPEAPVESITGLGVAVSVDPKRLGRWYNYRSTVGVITEISHHLAILFSQFGELKCPKCGTLCRRENKLWICPEQSCQTSITIPEPRAFSTSNYSSACMKCHGVRTLQKPRPEKLIVFPEKPLCKGAMYSPGFFPKGYLCKPYNGGYYYIQALAKRYNFDPMTTAWNEMTPVAQNAFLFGDSQPLEVTFESRKRPPQTRSVHYPGFYGWIRDWDVRGTYTQSEACEECNGTGFRKKYLKVTLANYNFHQLSQMPLKQLIQVLDETKFPNIDSHVASYSLRRIKRRLNFLDQVGLGYIHLSRIVMTLSAGEAQRIRLAGLLGSGLTSLTVLIDEPSRGLHPSEIKALLEALFSLKDENNTVIIIEHDPQIIQAADNIIDLGPGPGVLGGEIIAQGKLEEIKSVNDSITALWLRGERQFKYSKKLRKPQKWLKIYGAVENNLKGDLIELPLGVLLGVCGVSGSGKSTLIIDTLGRVLVPKKQTTSVAYEPIEPGKHEKIEGAPERSLIIDQSRKQVYSPLNFFNLRKPLLSLYGDCEDAKALGLDEKTLSQSCSACKGRGRVVIEMGFLPDVYEFCETCKGTGLTQEAWDIKLHGYSLPELYDLTLNEVFELFKNDQRISRPLISAIEVGLGYLVLKQPGYSLSGGECQRMKIALELSKKTSKKPTLYILDEPTIGQHLEDIKRLMNVLNRLVEEGNTVLIVEHHPSVLALCDWIVELGPKGGPDGGRVIAAGTPKDVAKGNTPSALYLREILEVVN